MTSERILAVGKIINGDTHVRVAVIETDSLALAAIGFGRRLYESGASRSACVNQHEEAGWQEAEYEDTAAAWDDDLRMELSLQPPLPPLQQIIDFAAEADEYEAWIEDNIWHSRGGW